MISAALITGLTGKKGPGSTEAHAKPITPAAPHGAGRACKIHALCLLFGG